LVGDRPDEPTLYRLASAVERATETSTKHE